jgi:hypothetical protein
MAEPPPAAPAHPLDDPDDAAALARYAAALLDAVEVAVPAWVARSVARVLAAQRVEPPPGLEDDVRAAGVAAVEDGVPRLRALLATDADAQGTNPLAVLRSLARYPTAVLRAAGARPVARDEFRERSFPDDVYDLAPASFGDIDETLHEPGLVWGAAKAHVHLARRRREGKR